MSERLQVTVDKVTKKVESTKTPDPAGGRIRQTSWTYALKNDANDVKVTIVAHRDMRLGEDDHVDVEITQRTWQAPLPRGDAPAKLDPDHVAILARAELNAAAGRRELAEDKPKKKRGRA